MPSCRHPGSRFAKRLSAAFTLVELLVSMSVLAILMLIVSQVITYVQRAWMQSNSRISQFREARMAFDFITRNIRQATLNAYWATDQGGFEFDAATRKASIPTRYKRQSELQFVSGSAVSLVKGAPNKTASYLPYHAVFFQAPLGVTQNTDYDRLKTLMCGRGYFVQYGDDNGFKPPFVTALRNRYRLMEYSPTTEQNAIYSLAKTITSSDSPQSASDKISKWFDKAGAAVSRSAAVGGTTEAGFTRPVAENIIALIIAPRVSKQQATAHGGDVHWIAPAYSYDSMQTGVTSADTPQGTQHLLPQMLDIVMIALDDTSGEKFTETMEQSLISSAPFSDATNLNLGSSEKKHTDIQAAEDYLVSKKMRYRIFSTTLELPGSRWSL